LRRRPVDRGLDSGTGRFVHLLAVEKQLRPDDEDANERETQRCYKHELGSS
jgi:hypothetical protein